MKPDISEWFNNPPDSIPEELVKHIDCEHAYKIVVTDSDMAFIWDKNLLDVHIVFNSDEDHKTYLMMNGRIKEDGNFHIERSTGDNMKVAAEWQE